MLGYVFGNMPGPATARATGRVIASIARRAVAVVGLGAFLAFGVPAAAQSNSDGFKFLEAVKKRDGATVEQLLSRPGSTLINSRDLSNGRTALHIAVDRRDRQWLNFLIGRGANPNLSDNAGVTPLMRASQMGFNEGVELLVAAGARIDEANEAGETPLILAVHRRDVGMMRVLLEAGANPDRADNSGRSARDYARLDGANSATLAELERKAESSTASASREVYGPTL